MKTNKQKTKWGIWITSSKCWMENNKRRKATYLKKSEALKDANDFNTMYKSVSKIYEVRKIQ